MVAADETLDELRRYDLRIIQKAGGYRFSLDPLLLCDFVDVGDGDAVMDLGTGCGVIPLVLARKIPGVRVVGVEHQKGMAELALRNAALNGLDDRITVLHGDVADLKRLFPVSSFDLVLANPPFRKPGTGRVSPRAGRDLARHESTAGLADFLDAAKYLVRPAGRICFIHHPTRLAEFLAAAAALKLAPLRLRLVHGSEGGEATMFLVELVKGGRGGLRVLPPLFVTGGTGGTPGSNGGVGR